MEDYAAAEHLQVIRTLMERTALYRRTLAPIMIYIGGLGTIAGAAALALRIEGSRAFAAWWIAAALLAVAGTFLIVRRQSMRDGEPFWSPPARRVTEAVLPPLAAGLIFSMATLAAGGPVRWLFVLPDAFFYGCAVHAAGFFMPRGMKLFGWLIIGLSAVAIAAFRWFEMPTGAWIDHAFMGALFGLLHLAYGGYLYLTEPGKSAA
jgi:hypothetical protein